MPTKRRFIEDHPIIYSQLRYLLKANHPALLQASDTDNLERYNIQLKNVLCHWHSLGPLTANQPQYPRYNLAEHHSLIVTLPEHQLQYLNKIFHHVAKPYNLTTSPVTTKRKRSVEPTTSD